MPPPSGKLTYLAMETSPEGKPLLVGSISVIFGDARESVGLQFLFVWKTTKIPWTLLWVKKCHVMNVCICMY